MNADIIKCKNVTVDRSIAYCAGCRRIIGYVDENNTVHLHNVRLVRFEPLCVRVAGNRQVHFIKAVDYVNSKRKYSIDLFDLLDEPVSKKQKVQQRLTVMRVNTNDNLNSVDFDFEEEDSEEEFHPELFWENSGFVTSTPGRLPENGQFTSSVHSYALEEYSSPSSHSDDSDEYDSLNEVDTWSEDESAFETDANFYSSNSSSRGSSDAISISSSLTYSPNSIENHPNFRAVSNVPNKIERPVLGNYSFLYDRSFQIVNKHYFRAYFNFILFPFFIFPPF